LYGPETWVTIPIVIEGALPQIYAEQKSRDEHQYNGRRKMYLQPTALLGAHK
jgi:hypothetical protein